MAGLGAIAGVIRSANGDGAAVSGEGDAGSGEIASGFSIDVSAELLPTGGPGACSASNRQGAGGWVIDIDDGLRF